MILLLQEIRLVINKIPCSALTPQSFYRIRLSQAQVWCFKVKYERIAPQFCLAPPYAVINPLRTG